MLHIVLLSRALMQSFSKRAAGFSLHDARPFQGVGSCEPGLPLRLGEGLGPLRAGRMELCLWAGGQNRLCPGASEDTMGVESVRRCLHQLEAQDLRALGSVTADYDR